MAFPYDNSAPGREAPAQVVSLAQLPRTRIIVSVLGTLLAMLLAALDQTIVATALPRVVADLEDSANSPGCLPLICWPLPPVSP